MEEALAAAPVETSFTDTGQSASFAPEVDQRGTSAGMCNVWLAGDGAGSVQLERSPDDGANWYPIYAAGEQFYTWTYAGDPISEQFQETEPGVVYRLNCTAYTSGTISTRLSQ